MWADHLTLRNDAIRDVYGESVTYTPASTGVAESISAVFDAAAEVVQIQGGVEVSARTPVLDVVLADLLVHPKGRAVGSSDRDLVTVGGVSYQVVKVEPDGQGWARLILARA